MIPAELRRLAKALPQLTGRDGETYRLPGGKVGLLIGRVLKASGRMSVQSLLSTDDVDYDGDRINPAGGDWSTFAANPLVNWEHEVPIGTGTVPTLKAFKVGAETFMLPVGETTFFKSAADCRGLQLHRRDRSGRVVGKYSPDECAHAAASSARLVGDGVAEGVSIEFRPNGVEGKAFWQRTGHDSVLLGRPEMHWESWLGEGWAHAMRAKNPNAATILGTVRFDKAFRIAETGKFPGGERVSPLVLKSFAPFRDYKPQFHRVGKAMPDMMDDAPPGVDTVAPAADKPAGGGMKPTPKLIMTAMQHFKDGTAMIREAVEGETVEHEGGIDILTDYADKIDALLNKMNAEAAKEFPDAGFGSADPTAAEPDGDEMPVETNDDGAITNKAFPGGFPVRFRVARDGTGYERVEPAADPADGEATILAKAIADKKAEYERRLRRAERRADRLDRVAENNRRNGRL